MTDEITNGQPWKQQYDSNLAQSGHITSWGYGTSLLYALANSHAVVTRNRAYLVGGKKAAGTTAEVYTATISLDGILGSWSLTSNPIPQPVSDGQLVLTKNRVYLLGGLNSSGGDLATIYTAVVSEEGIIGSWSSSGTLPVPISSSQAVITTNRIYLLCGHISSYSYTGNTYTAPIDSDGIIGAWTTGTVVPRSMLKSEVAVTDGQVYILGGYTASIDKTIYKSTFGVDGVLSAWSTYGTLPGEFSDAQAVITRNTVYYYSTYTGVSYIATINPDGTIGSWSTTTEPPFRPYSSQIITTNSRMYILGGEVGGTKRSDVLVSTFIGGSSIYITISNFWTNFKGQTELIV